MLQPVRRPWGPDPTDCAGFGAFQQREQCPQTPPPAPPSIPVGSDVSSSSFGASTPCSDSSATSQSTTWLSVYGDKKPFYQTARCEESRYASRFLANAGRYDPLSPGYRQAHCEVWLNEILNGLLSGWQLPLREAGQPSQPVPPPPPNTPEPARSPTTASHTTNAAAEPEPPRMASSALSKARQNKRETPMEKTMPTPRSPLMAPPAPSKPRPHKRKGRAAQEPASSANSASWRAPMTQTQPSHRYQPAPRRALWVPNTPPRARHSRKRVRISTPATSPELASPRPRMARPEQQQVRPVRDPVVFIDGRPLTLLLRPRAE